MGEEVLRLWRQTGATVFLITHALDEAAMLADRIGVMSARPGVLLDIVDDRLVQGARQPRRGGPGLRGDHRKVVAGASPGVAQGDQGGRGFDMTRVLLRIAVIVAFVALLELLCRTGVIDNFTMPPPSRIVGDLGALLASGKLIPAILKTLGNAATAFVMAVSIGIVSAVVIHSLRPLREALDPLFATYYAIPVLAFYPLLIILFGLGDMPQILIAFMLGVVAVIVNTLNGLDRVPRVLLKTARIARMSRVETALKVTLPYAIPYVLTGVKFAIAYSLIGIIGSEFIMSKGGMGFEIAFAYTNFDNATMYPLILLILVVSVTANMLLGMWERTLLARRGQR